MRWQDHITVWDPNYPPENPDGPPPYVFRNVPAGANVSVSFVNPIPPSLPATRTEVLQAQHGDGSSSSAARSIEYSEEMQARAAAHQPAPAAASRPRRRMTSCGR